jgi:hypothetical protein
VPHHAGWTRRPFFSLESGAGSDPLCPAAELDGGGCRSDRANLDGVDESDPLIEGEGREGGSRFTHSRDRSIHQSLIGLGRTRIFYFGHSPSFLSVTYSTISVPFRGTEW